MAKPLLLQSRGGGKQGPPARRRHAAALGGLPRVVDRGTQQPRAPKPLKPLPNPMHISMCTCSTCMRICMLNHMQRLRHPMHQIARAQRGLNLG